MDQCIKTYVLHVYTMDTCYILCFYNNILILMFFPIQQTL